MVKCPVCGQEIRNTRNLGLHVSSKHPEEFQRALFGDTPRGEVEEAGKNDSMKYILNADNIFERERRAFENKIVAPKNAIIEVTENCPLNCIHCLVGERDKTDLPLESWFKILDRLKEIGVENVVVEGGEPMMYKNIDRFLDYCTGRFKEVSVQTSGYTLPDLNHHDINLTVSLEYLDPETNNGIRRIYPNSKYKYLQDKGLSVERKNMDKFKELWEKLEQGDKSVMDEIKELGFEENSFERAVNTLMINSDLDRTVRTTIYSDNDVLGLAYFAERIGVNSTFVPLKPVGFGESLKDKVPSVKRLREIVKDIMALNEHTRMNHRVEETYWYLANEKIWRRFGDVFKQRKRVCEAGINRVFVNHKGDATPCLMFPEEIMGNFLNDDNHNILRNMYDWSVKMTDFVNSKRCNHCFGGCLATAEANKNMTEIPCIFPIER